MLTQALWPLTKPIQSRAPYLWGRPLRQNILKEDRSRDPGLGGKSSSVPRPALWFSGCSVFLPQAVLSRIEQFLRNLLLLMSCADHAPASYHHELNEEEKKICKYLYLPINI